MNLSFSSVYPSMYKKERLEGGDSDFSRREGSLGGEGLFEESGEYLEEVRDLPGEWFLSAEEEILERGTSGPGFEEWTLNSATRSRLW